ncbi:E3 ubiquitin-protein ligase UBR2 [Halotydeus destructor]|nr:E3 ubiquitin-protein ligase UBR2 [Halotydeus destructor]
MFCQSTSAALPIDSASDLGQVVVKWLKRFDEKTLTKSDFRRYWAEEVISIYSPKRDCDCLNITYDEEAAKRILLEPLERFLTLSVDSESVLNDLKKLDSPPTLCGRVFKGGEPTYSCRDCGLDPTCVLCVDCFKNSAHKKHKYKMSTSSGGGYCDCGDEEAWKSDPYCQVHAQGADKAESDSDAVIAKLPKGVGERFELMVRTILGYCFDVLSRESGLRLPEDLQFCENDSDTVFTTMLFNDEIHTYDQVISTLIRAIDCTHRQAVDYATTIDREGRSIVKCSSFQACLQVKSTIERITSRHGSKPLLVEVMHFDIVAHQNFAMRLLQWLQNLLGYCEAFRHLFRNTIANSEGHTGVQQSPSLLEQVMRTDAKLWKMARNQWHELFISGMLMEIESKKAFAKVFTRVYGDLIKDFMNDDHEHSVSITSMSVQLYTVPSLAHLLIAEDDALFILLKAFVDECRKHKTHEGILAFERNNTTIMCFRRAQFILVDLKYLLTTKPMEWTEEMRTNFVHAFRTLVELLEWMQGMDPVVRQVGQHVEFEAEWETGINMQLKLAPVLSLMIDWCGSDKKVLLKTLRIALNQLVVKLGRLNFIPRTIRGVSVSDCIEYDVSSLPISVHLPLSRLVAGLLLHLSRHEVDYNRTDLQIRTPTPVELMELSLRNLVMISQFRAGMWRRNGYSLVNQVYFYHNVRLREEMYDRDVLTMQYVAAQMDPDKYIVHLISKFNLLLWVQDNYESAARKPEEDYLRQTITLAEELLGMILIIVSERHTPGVGKVNSEEKLKKEIIQWLCVESMTHSDLLKVLPKETVYDSVIETFIRSVADFKRPGANQAGGKYEVKPEFYKEFNPFFYHYTRQDQSTAEEVQLKRKKQANEAYICCPPPVPPELSNQFSPLKNLLNCDLMLHMIHLVLSRTLSTYSISFSETQLEKSLHLIGLALHEEDRYLKKDRENEIEFRFTEPATQKGIFSQLEECLKSPKAQGHKDLVQWVIAKFTDVAKQQGHSVNSSVQNSSSDQGCDGNAAKQRNAELAAQRRARIMAQMQSMQKNFIQENAEYFQTEPTYSASGHAGSLMDVSSEDTTDQVAVGPKRSQSVVTTEEHSCILCREEQTVSSDNKCLVLAAFVQRSTVLSKNRSRRVNNSEENIDSLFMPSDLYVGPHISTCGHVMHGDCWQKFFDSVLTRERRRPVRYGRHVSFDVEKNEFLCPLCECLSNTVIPILPNMASDIKTCPKSIHISHWLTAMHSAVEKVQPIWIKDPSMSVETGEKYICRFKASPLEAVGHALPDDVKEDFLAVIKQYETDADITEKLPSCFTEMMQKLSQSVYTISLTVNPNADDDRVSLLSYWACAFTIHSIERVMRNDGKTIFHELSSRKFNCLQALVRYVGSLSSIVNVAIIRSHCIRLLRFLLINEHHNSSASSCLDIDAFGLTVSLVLTTPSLYVRENSEEPDFVSTLPAGNVFDQHLVNLVLVLHIVQVILTSDFESEEPMETDQKCLEPSFEQSFVAELISELRLVAGVPMKQKSNCLQSERTVSSLKTKLLPYLRCTAMLYHFLTNVPPPTRLSDAAQLPMSCEEEYTVLCSYLNLPSKIHGLLESPSVRQLAMNWTRHSRVHSLVVSRNNAGSPTDMPLKLIEQPHEVNQLIELPADYSELINSVSLFTCPNSDSDDSRSPTMCLVCGTMLCSQSYCCQTELDGTMVGACTYHTHICGAGIGIFLRIRDCKILLLAGKSKGCYMSPPYIDEYGETDQGLVRGNPLHLCEASYKELHRLWLRHGIPEQIAHALELSTNLAATNWPLI